METSSSHATFDCVASNTSSGNKTIAVILFKFAVAQEACVFQNAPALVTLLDNGALSDPSWPRTFAATKLNTRQPAASSQRPPAEA